MTDEEKNEIRIQYALASNPFERADISARYPFLAEAPPPPAPPPPTAADIALAAERQTALDRARAELRQIEASGNPFALADFRLSHPEVRSAPAPASPPLPGRAAVTQVVNGAQSALSDQAIDALIQARRDNEAALAALKGK